MIGINPPSKNPGVPAIPPSEDIGIGINPPSKEPGTPMVPQTYSLEHRHYLRAQCFRQLTGEMRWSTLDLDYCLAEQEFKIVTESTPPDLSNPSSDYIHPFKLSESLAHGDCETYLRGGEHGPRIHFRKEKWTIGGSVHDSAIELAPYLRHAPDGVLEYVYPFYQDDFPAWLRTVGEVATIIKGAMDEANKSGLEKAFDKALEKWQEWLNDGKHNVQPDIKAFMKGTYVDNGKLVRRGS